MNIRWLLGIIVAPPASAFVMTVTVFIIDAFHDAAGEKSLLRDWSFNGSVDSFLLTCQWTYLLSVFPGLFFLLILRAFKCRSFLSYIISGVVFGQILPFLAWADDGGSILNWAYLLIALLGALVGSVGFFTYWRITCAPKIVLNSIPTSAP